nr:hypothetical protein [Actinomycetes bacterium]
SAPGAGYEVQYDNFDVLAIGTNGTATKVHVDVPVLGAPPPDPQPTEPAPPPTDPAPPPTDPAPAPQDPVPSPIESATYTLTTIDFDNGLVSGELNIDPATVARYEISGGLKGTVLLTDNAFEYRPTAQAQEAASAPGAGYEVQYDNFDVLAIGTNGTATKVHVDVPVLGQPPFDVR